MKCKHGSTSFSKQISYSETCFYEIYYCSSLSLSTSAGAKIKCFLYNSHCASYFPEIEYILKTVSTVSLKYLI